MNTAFQNNNLNSSYVSKRKIATIIAIAALCSKPVMSEETQLSGFTLTPSVGYHTHSVDRQGIKDSGTLSLGAGYQFNTPWAAELTYLTSNPKEGLTGTKLDEEHLRLDALYHFLDYKTVQPYTVFGLGKTRYTNDSSLKSYDEFFNGGLGLRYAFNDVVSLRSDVRVLRYFDSKSTEAAFNLGVSFLLGGKSAATKTTVRDTDNDGVADGIDSCAGTDVNVAVDSTGCAIKIDKDTDKDGVLNDQDKCPDTQAGAKVMADGCYEILKESRSVVLSVQFANNADSVVSSSDSQIKSLVQFMKEYPNTKVVIEGHTDNRGSEAYNQSLSQKRAQAVANIIVKQYGIKASRVSAKGFGEIRPAATNATADGRAQNRRVEAVVSAEVEVIVK